MARISKSGADASQSNGDEIASSSSGGSSTISGLLLAPTTGADREEVKVNNASVTEMKHACDDALKRVSFSSLCSAVSNGCVGWAPWTGYAYSAIWHWPPTVWPHPVVSLPHCTHAIPPFLNNANKHLPYPYSFFLAQTYSNKYTHIQTSGSRSVGRVYSLPLAQACTAGKSILKRASLSYGQG